MSFSFWAATTSGEASTQVLSIPEVNVVSPNYARIVETLKLETYGYNDNIWDGGRCTPDQLRQALELYPDGHPDPYLTQRFGELAQLMHAAAKTGDQTVIVWG